jgi:hypothetical protein
MGRGLRVRLALVGLSKSTSNGCPMIALTSRPSVTWSDITLTNVILPVCLFSSLRTVETYSPHSDLRYPKVRGRLIHEVAVELNLVQSSYWDQDVRYYLSHTSPEIPKWVRSLEWLEAKRKWCNK